MAGTVWILVALAGVALIVWGAEAFARHLSVASVRLGVSAFALALLLAGAEPEELATAVTASLRDAPGLAFGDVIGANVAICLVALGVGALVAPLPFTRRVRRYALAGLPLGALAAAVAWDGHVGRTAGLVLVLAYVGFVGVIWWLEHGPPALGETGELDEAQHAEEAQGAQGAQDHGSHPRHRGEDGPAPGPASAVPAPAAGPGGPPPRDPAARRRRVGRELALVLAGVAAMAVGATALVEGIRRLSGVEATQTRLGLTVVGFATAFELVVLAWSSARRGVTEAAVAGVIGSYAYNSTMTLGAGALARPLTVLDASLLRVPWVVMLLSLAVVLALTARGALRRGGGVALLALYPVAVLVMVLV